MSTFLVSPSSSPQSSLLPAAICCFVAGATTATAVCYYWVVRPLQQQQNHDDRPESNDETSTTTTSPQHETWSRRLSFTNVVEDISARIGDTGARKIPWPWMDINRRKKQKKMEEEEALQKQQQQQRQQKENTATSTNDNAVDPNTSTNFSTSENPLGAEDKTDLCIGSIFGLDVGGTLAKLVYFEERPLYRHSNGISSTSQANIAKTMRRSTANLAVMAHPAKRYSVSAFHNRKEEKDRQQPSLMQQKSISARDISMFGTSTGTISETNQSTLEQHAESDEEDSSENDTPEQPAHLPMRPSKLDLRQTRSHDGVKSLDPINSPPNAESGEGDDLQSEVPGQVRRTQSMLDFLTQREHRAQALDRFYAFARENLTNGSSGNATSASSTESETTSGQEPTAQPSETQDGVPTDSTGGTDAQTQQQQKDATPQQQQNNELVRDDNLSFDCLDGTFHFLHFETRKMQYATNLIRRYELHQTIHSLGATGGGAHKFAQVFQDELGITMKKVDELESLVAGMQFVLQTVVGECYTYRPPQEQPPSTNNNKKLRKTGSSSSSLNNHYGNYVGVEQENWSGLDETETNTIDKGLESKSGTSEGGQSTKEQPQEGEDSDNSASSSAAPRTGTRLDEWWWSRKVPRDAISDASTYPYLLVTIGTGVSILRVDGPRKHERISGSTIGGGTYWGLIRLLTSVENFSNVIELAEKGDPSKVDMMVGDIYGSNPEALEKLGLREDLVASSFGKLVAKEDPAEGLKEEDLARALLLMVTNNIGQVAYLNAQLHQTSRIYFVGNFLRQNKLSQRRLSFAIDFWSKGKMEALFLEHEGYFGALGAFLMSQGFSSYPAQLHHIQQQNQHPHHRHNPRPFSSQHSMPPESTSHDENDSSDGDNQEASAIAAAAAAFKRRSFTSLDGTS